MTHRRNKEVSAAQCTRCGRFFRTRKASACPHCWPSDRNVSRQFRKHQNRCKHQPVTIRVTGGVSVVVCSLCMSVMLDKGDM